jgi:hypothetical protein
MSLVQMCTECLVNKNANLGAHTESFTLCHLPLYIPGHHNTFLQEGFRYGASLLKMGCQPYSLKLLPKTWWISSL